jgi:hypothetical protein
MSWAGAGDCRASTRPRGRPRDARTDIFFIEAQLFEKGRTAAGDRRRAAEKNQQNQISRRQKEIIAATWNQQRDKRSSRAEQLEVAKFLSDMQATLRDQAKSLAAACRAASCRRRTRSSSFTKDTRTRPPMLNEAADKLKGANWQKRSRLSRRRCGTCCAPSQRPQDPGMFAGAEAVAVAAAALFATSKPVDRTDTENQYETAVNRPRQPRQQEVDEALQKSRRREGSRSQPTSGQQEMRWWPRGRAVAAADGADGAWPQGNKGNKGSRDNRDNRVSSRAVRAIGPVR